MVKIFCSYAHEDKNHREQLERYLGALKHQGYIEVWCDREIGPGMLWDQEIHEHLDTADLFLPLVSAYFLASQYCWGVEMQRALERLNREEVAIVPILVRPVVVQGTPISHLQMLPTGGKPISRWSNREEAYTDVATGIGKVVDRLRAQKWKLQGDAYCDQQTYDSALEAYQEADSLDPGLLLQDPYFYYAQGKELYRLQRFEEAIRVYEKATALKPGYHAAWNDMGDAYKQTSEEYQRRAEQCYQRADELDAKKIGKYDLASLLRRRKSSGYTSRRGGKES